VKVCWRIDGLFFPSSEFFHPVFVVGHPFTQRCWRKTVESDRGASIHGDLAPAGESDLRLELECDLYASESARPAAGASTVSVDLNRWEEKAGLCRDALRCPNYGRAQSTKNKQTGNNEEGRRGNGTIASSSRGRVPSSCRRPTNLSARWAVRSAPSSDRRCQSPYGRCVRNRAAVSVPSRCSWSESTQSR
jgi:hypothetical protein